MCIMEVRPGQRSSTIAQAMAHNVSTVERDLEMFVPLLEARGEAATLATINDARERLETAYRLLLSVFANELADDTTYWGHSHGDHGHERTPAEIDEAMLRAARRYETR